MVKSGTIRLDSDETYRLVRFSKKLLLLLYSELATEQGNRTEITEKKKTIQEAFDL